MLFVSAASSAGNRVAAPLTKGFEYGFDMGSKITVVGSINVDLVIKSERIPRAGETITGGAFQVISGGKGANQAVAVARQGVSTSFIGCIGDDNFGRQQRAALLKEHINLDYVSEIASESTGVAIIIIEPDGDNRIILSPGANARLTPAMIEGSEQAIADADILICQLETPVRAAQRALEIARRHGTTTILNPAPAIPLTSSILSLCDYLIPNETEAEALSGVAVSNPESAQKAAEIIGEHCPGTVMITLGEQGVLTRADGQVDFTEALSVKAIDTTAAGDTFIGSLAAFLASGDPLEIALKKAMYAAALSVTKKGAQTSIPGKHEFEDFYLMRSGE